MERKKYSYKNEQRHSNKSNNKKKTIDKYNEISNKNIDERNLNKLLESYHNYFRANFGNYKFVQKSDIFSQKMKEKETDMKANININIKESKKDFDNFVNSIPPYTFEDNIIINISDISELLLNNDDQCGKNKNNKSDYLYRKYKNIETVIINSDLAYDEPLEDQNEDNIKEDMNIDIYDLNNKIALNQDENETPNQPIINDEEIREKFEYIVDYWREHRKKIKLFAGYKRNFEDIYVIYGKGLDRNGKIKNIELNRCLKMFDYDRTSTEKSVKELFNVDSMTKEELSNKIDDIIKIFDALGN